MKASFVSFLLQKYPHLSAENLNSVISDQLLSPFQVTLNPTQLLQIKHEINSYWNLRSWGAQNLSEQYKSLGLNIPNNFSACMSYDFHINSEGQPELIEINTNASFLALGLELYEYLNLPLAPFDFSEVALIEMFKNEIELTGKALSDGITIIDDKPSEQRLFIEFLIYIELFRKHGIKSQIADYREHDKIKSAALIYNRFTDFYLSSQESKQLRKAFNETLNFSPNPYEYFLLADKQRLIDWNLQELIEKPKSLLPVYDLGITDKDKIWAEKKNLFIKPKNSYGSKQAYKAASISHKIFDKISNENFIAQKLSIPSEIECEYEGQKIIFKYDLRCFAYQNKLQLIVARLYQGQTTNLKTTGGGFSAVKLS